MFTHTHTQSYTQSHTLCLSVSLSLFIKTHTRSLSLCLSVSLSLSVSASLFFGSCLQSVFPPVFVTLVFPANTHDTAFPSARAILSAKRTHGRKLTTAPNAMRSSSIGNGSASEPDDINASSSSPPRPKKKPNGVRFKIQQVALLLDFEEGLALLGRR